ncbi:hypothetical protein JGS22_006950 [Streptomyces sp. P38-E01]|uniref:Uncharacterized protein n=1 Tax=Streptomyces tardus TaxID=2780544 RepID=A0A949JLL8_9ACTN|nr:hypothetical protein [Streptomyces tardus]MBU7597376.1 hypothetical protein [Streptomyces tardus]
MTSARSIHRFLSTRLGEVRRHLAAFIITSALIALFICLIAIPTAHIFLTSNPGPPLCICS